MFVFVFAYAPRSAHAEDKAKAREAYSRGTQAYDFGEYAAALEAFKEAYRNFEDANILFNIAQCHRQLGQNQEAIRVYRSYLRHAPKSANSDEVRQIVARLEKTIEEENTNRQQPPHGTIDAGSVGKSGEPAASTVGPEAPSPPVAPEAKPVQSSPPALMTPTPVVDRNAGRTKRIAGIAVAAVGLGALAAGIALEVLAKQTSDQLTQIDRAGGQFDEGKDHLGKVYDTAGPVLLGIGGAALITGTVVAVLGIKAKTTRVAVLPVLAPQSAGALVRVGF